MRRAAAPPAPPAALTPVADDPVAAQVAAAKASRASAARPAEPRHCLIVDDSRVVRKVARRIAEGLGYRVTEAENGEEALSRCQVAMPHLVLTDWQMPVMSGIEFVTRLRALPASRAPVVVFCTSKGAARDIHDGIAAGADDYVLKPFDEAQLKAKLEGLAS
ncbi:response regulator [Erythrobacteraceae bacterium CFH 75059]|nr:response regulator [Erythrobacteraceae bacterium CFH 75059]